MSYKQYLQKKECGNGFGVFTKIVIPANSPILEFGGDSFTKETLKHGPSQFLQIGTNKYLGPSGDIDDYINHSCSPNCHLSIIGFRAILYSTYLIAANSELTFDYSTSSTDNISEWAMKCNCGKQNCRKIISGFRYLDDDVKEFYRSNNRLPLFIK